MRIEIELLRREIEALLVDRGVPVAEASTGADMCLDAELRGHRSHGVRLLRNVLREYAAGVNRRGRCAVIQQTDVSAIVDGGFHLSWYVHRLGADLTAEKALAGGIGLVSVVNAGVSGALGYLVERMSSVGLVALAANSSPLGVVAPGSTTPMFGTNPIAVGVPRDSYPPVILDMATSAIAFNEIRRRQANGKELPAGVAVTDGGEPTTSPELALDSATGRSRILPFGGHRGYGLALMVELIAAAGVTGRVGTEKLDSAPGDPADFSGLYLAFRPDLIGDAASAALAATRLINALTDQGARVPGEASRAHRESCVADGFVELDEDGAAVLDELGVAT